MKVQSIDFCVAPDIYSIDPNIKVTMARCIEAVNQIPEYHIELKVSTTTNDALNPLLWIGKQGVLVAKQTINRTEYEYLITGVIQSLEYLTGLKNSDNTEFNKIILKMTHWPIQENSLYYKRNYRVFQGLNSKEIAEELFKALGVELDDTMLNNNPPPTRAWEVQYGESDAEFLARIMAEDNLIFNLTALPGSPGSGNTTFLQTKMTLYKRLAEFSVGALELNRTTSGGSEGAREGVYDVSTLYQRGVQNIIANSTLQPPEFSNLTVSVRNDESKQRIVDILPDEKYKTTDIGQSKIELIRDASSESQFLFESELLAIAPGNCYLTSNFTSSGLHIAVTKTSKEFTVTNNGDYILRVSSKAQIKDSKFTPTPVPRPQLPGLLYARVLDATAKPGYSEVLDDDGQKRQVHTDKFARVKVRINWPGGDRNDDEQTNFDGIWLRMMTPWAGESAGFLAIPHVGQEVIVSFIHGDANSPVVLGCLYSTQEYSTPWNIEDSTTDGAPQQNTQKKWVGIGSFNKNEPPNLIALRTEVDNDVALDKKKYPITNTEWDEALKTLNSAGMGIKLSTPGDISARANVDMFVYAGNKLIQWGVKEHRIDSDDLTNINSIKEVQINAPLIKINGKNIQTNSSYNDWDVAFLRKTATIFSESATGLLSSQTTVSFDLTGMANNIAGNVNSAVGVSTELTGMALSARLAQLSSYGISATLGGVDVSAIGVSIGLSGVTFKQSAFTIQC